MPSGGCKGDGAREDEISRRAFLALRIVCAQIGVADDVAIGLIFVAVGNVRKCEHFSCIFIEFYPLLNSN